MNDDITNEELDRYLSGEASAAERSRIEAWIAADPSRATLIEALRSSFGVAPGGDWDVEAAWRGVRERIAGDTAAAAPRRAGWRRAPALLRAAVLAGLLAGGWMAARLLLPATESPVFAAVATAVAERDTVSLPDGSTVVLAPQSRLAAIALDDTVRAFDLTGEAYFSVRSDAGRPFRIRTGGVVTEVLGTEFTVRAREASAVTIAVREGRVSVTNGEAALTLAAGQVALAVAGEAPQLLEVDPDAWLSWLDGVLEFDGDRLDVVAAELSRWFGRDVVLADTALSARRVTGRFVTTSPEQALDALSVTLGIAWEERDGAFVLGAAGRN